jgi:(p)ppGpp synthase/HD superfamily hydrolase
MKQKSTGLGRVSHHGDQKYGEDPYSVHLDAVANIAKPFGELAEAVAYLHDVVEDTDVTVEQVSAEFGELVASCVAILSDEPGHDRKDRKAKTYKKMAAVSGEQKLALIVKASDRLANVRACVLDNHERLLAVYKSEHAAFKQSVNRVNLCESLWDELNTIIDSKD